LLSPGGARAPASALVGGSARGAARMSVALLWRDLREVRWLLVGLVGLAVFGVAVAMHGADESGGRLTPIGWWLEFWGWAVSVSLALRLFYRPQIDGTIRLFDALPVSRSTVFWTRVGLGGAVTMALHLAVSGWVWGTSTGVTTAQFGVVWVTTAAYQAALWGLAVLGATLGRYRWLLWVVVVEWMGLVATLIGPLSPWVPLLPLISEDRTLATQPLAPWLVVEGWAVGAASLGLAWALAVASGGDVAARLVRPLRPREWVAAIVGVWVASYVMQQAEAPGEPMDVRGAETVEVDGVKVSVTKFDPADPFDAIALGEAVAAAVGRANAVMGGPPPPPLWLIARPEFDVGAFAPVELGGLTGVALAVSVADAADGGSMALRGGLTRQVLRGRSFNLGSREDARWLRDGVAMWAAAEDRDRPTLRLQAAALASWAGADDLSAWERTSERLGRCGADALAFAATEALVALIGEAGLAAAAPRLYPPTDRAWETAWRREPMQAVLADLGVSIDDVATVLRATLAAVAEAEAAPLAARPGWSATWAAERLGGGQRAVTLTVGPEAPLDGWWVQRLKLGLLYGTVEPDLRRVDAIEASLRLPGVFVAGDVMVLHAEAMDPVLGCAVRLGPGRVVIP
jgi:hypothetical protein